MQLCQPCHRKTVKRAFRKRCDVIDATDAESSTRCEHCCRLAQCRECRIVKRVQMIAPPKPVKVLPGKFYTVQGTTRLAIRLCGKCRHRKVEKGWTATDTFLYEACDHCQRVTACVLCEFA